VGCDVVAHNSKPVAAVGIDSSIPRRKLL